MHIFLWQSSLLMPEQKKMVPCPTLLGVLLWVISLFSQGVWSPEGELWRTYAWAVKQDRSVSGKHLHSEFIPKNRVTAKRTYSVRVPETRTKRIGYMKSLPSASWFFFCPKILVVGQFWDLTYNTLCRFHLKSVRRNYTQHFSNL